MKRHVRRRAFFSSATLMPSAPDGDGDGNGAAADCFVAETQQESPQPASANVPPPSMLPPGREVCLTGVHPEELVVPETQLS